MPFDDSRRLTGANLFFAATGAVLETVGIAVDEALLEQWRDRIERARGRLGWPAKPTVSRGHAAGVSLAIAAPCDQLFVATEINEWALCSALSERDPERWRGLEEALAAAAIENAPAAQGGLGSESARGADDAATEARFDPPVLGEAAALVRFERLALGEARPPLRALAAMANERDLQNLFDETDLTLGAGEASRDYQLTGLPAVTNVPWSEVRNIPTALVTGSNGKTTTVRLLAACARAHGWHTSYSCTDGVFLDDEMLVAGDYSGPAGTRLAIRERRAQAAIVETARGGILRRGIALSRADVAVVTNISSDHFGEYGIDNLEGLADVKLTVAGVLSSAGVLVLNADDPQLRAKAATLESRFGRRPVLGWFARETDHPILREHRALGFTTCAASGTCEAGGGRLLLSSSGIDHDLGAVSAMPLTVDSTATYNIYNLAGAAIAAVALGIAPATVAAVFARFGASPEDNLGRLMRYSFKGATVIVDYAHNADGLRNLLSVAEHLRGGKGRLALVLGHAGNRQDAEIQALARVAAGFHPELIVVKENESQLRGRQPGEVPRIIRQELLRAGMQESSLRLQMTEIEAARYTLEGARPGDMLVLPIHSSAARAAVTAMLRGG